MRLKLSQTELAEALGIHRTAVARYEVGMLPVPKVVVLAIEALERRAAEARKTA